MASCRRCYLSSEFQSSGVMFIKAKRNEKRRKEIGPWQPSGCSWTGLYFKWRQMSLTEKRPCENGSGEFPQGLVFFSTCKERRRELSEGQAMERGLHREVWTDGGEPGRRASG